MAKNVIENTDIIRVRGLPLPNPFLYKSFEEWVTACLEKIPNLEFGTEEWQEKEEFYMRDP